jgi:antitoxin (DNA-binding transcriptional repressor) of toxin-antitoxin stability system
MRTIGIRELKAQLSSALREVQRGEVLLVTDRGRVIAELRSPGTIASAGRPSERALAELAAKGRLRLAEEQPRYQLSPIKSPAGRARELLDEDRAE